MLNLATHLGRIFRDTVAGNLSRLNSRALKIIGARERPAVRVLGQISVSLMARSSILLVPRLNSVSSIAYA
jgi:hypothetical protein